MDFVALLGTKGGSVDPRSHFARRGRGIAETCGKRGRQVADPHHAIPHSSIIRRSQDRDAGWVKALALLPSDDPAYGLADWEAAIRPHWSGPLFVGTDGMRIGLP